jgi:molybdopterin/thiamine biosynthesis adenylyltransferase
MNLIPSVFVLRYSSLNRQRIFTFGDMREPYAAVAIKQSLLESLLEDLTEVISSVLT